MKKIFLLFLAVMFLYLNQINAGVIKESKSSVSFGGFGKFLTQTTSKTEGLKKREDSRKDFKGQGFMAGMMSRMFAKNGNTAEIINLKEMKIYNLNIADRQYYVTPVEKMDWQQMSEQGTAEQGAEQEESQIKIIRTVFNVNDTGQKKKINQFACRKYHILWLSQWINTETGEKGTDSLHSVVWTTKLTADLQKAADEEMKFNKKYMEKIGLPVDQTQSEMLGMDWLSMYKNMNQGRGARYKTADRTAFKQLQKIKGYAVVIDGKFYLKRINKSGADTESGQAINALNGLLGGMMNPAGKKKDHKPQMANGFKMAFSFYTEIVRLKSARIPEKTFVVPAGYTKIER